jgi:hypothetical protein
MARRIKTVTATTTENSKRARRTPEEIVADLQTEIERVKQQAAAMEARADPNARGPETYARWRRGRTASVFATKAAHFARFVVILTRRSRLAGEFHACYHAARSRASPS